MTEYRFKADHAGLGKKAGETVQASPAEVRAMLVAGLIEPAPEKERTPSMSATITVDVDTAPKSAPKTKPARGRRTK